MDMELVKRYENLIEKIKSHQKELRSELSELIVKELNKDENEYIHHLMGWIKSGDSRIKHAEYDMNYFKEENKL